MVELAGEEDLLVGDQDVGHGVQTEDVPQPPLDVAVEVKDGGAEEPEVEDVPENVLQVAEVDGEGGEEEGEAEGEDQLDEEGQGQEEGL